MCHDLPYHDVVFPLSQLVAAVAVHSGPGHRQSLGANVHVLAPGGDVTQGH